MVAWSNMLDQTGDHIGRQVISTKVMQQVERQKLLDQMPPADRKHYEDIDQFENYGMLPAYVNSGPPTPKSPRKKKRRLGRSSSDSATTTTTTAATTTTASDDYEVTFEDDFPMGPPLKEEPIVRLGTSNNLTETSNVDAKKNKNNDKHRGHPAGAEGKPHRFHKFRHKIEMLCSRAPSEYAL